MTDPPGAAGDGATFTITDTVTNNGNGPAGASETRYFLSVDGVSHGAYLGNRAVPALLATGSTNTGTATVKIPNGAAEGTYRVVACADATSLVTEADETNNCAASTGSVVVTAPDLIETAISNPPSTNVMGTTFAVTDTAQNLGHADAGATTTYFYLSLDGTHIAPGTSPLGNHTTTTIAPGATLDGGATLTVPGGTAVGTYYILGCANQAKTIAESNGNNNCLGSTSTMTVSGADLVETGVTVSPATIGTSAFAMITVADTVTNNNPTDAGASTTRYLLSQDGTTNFGWIRACTVGDPIPQRNVSAVGASSSDSGSTTFAACYHSVATNTYQPFPPGTYYIIACTDDLKAVTETNEKNNCTTSSNTFTVTAAVCGNGVVETGEQCDDGNLNNGDGCSSTCTTETLTSITIDPLNKSIAAGRTVQYTATGHYNDGSQTDETTAVAWASTDSSVTLSAGGLATTTVVGSTTISATLGALSASTPLTITAPEVVSLVVDPQDPSIANLTQQQFTAFATFTDGSTGDVTTQVAWTSGTTSVATIGASTGLATAASAGTSLITASITTSTGPVSDTSTLTVTSATVTGIQVTPANTTIAKGTSIQMTAVATFSDLTTQDITGVAAWTATPTNKVSVTSPGGLVTGTSPTSSGNVRATFGGLTGSTGITVSSANLQSIAVTPSTARVPKGFSQQYTAIGTFVSGGTVTTQDLTTQVNWSSNATGVATITSKGKATATGAGTATITASLSGKTGTATLTGTIATLSTIAITPSPLSVANGSSTQLTATGTFSNGDTLDLTRQVVWSTSAKSVANISGAGVLRAKKVGTPTVTAKNGAVTGSIVATINP